MRRVEGVVTGIVKEIDAEHARVKLDFPWLQPSYRSNWAPIAAPMSGDKRGMFMMPELDDEVLVAFDHCSVEHPYVIGFLWNGVDRAPEDGTGAGVRRLRTVSGHVVEFDDRPGNERILIKTKGEHEIELKDGPAASITISTAGKQKLTLNDVPPGITVETAGMQKITVSDAPPGITASVAGGGISISATAAGVTITAPSVLTVNVPIAQFTGVVQASAIVASAYTPAPGNTFGL